jgi:sugar porter (SP) family MFS transporter
VLAALYVVSGLGCALAASWEAFVIFRFIAGLAIGGSSVLAPVYISELSPPRRRGALVGLFQLNIVAGILVAYLSNYLIGEIDLAGNAWRWKLGATVIPSIVFLALLFSIPPSARWLAARGRVAEARRVLDMTGVANVEEELQSIERSLDVQRDGGRQKLSWSLHRKPILLAISIAFFNQVAGINAILYYANDIFAAAGYSSLSSNLQTVAIGATNLLFTILALLVIDRVGRKKLLLIGSVGMAVCLSIAALVMSGRLSEGLLIFVLVGFIAFFAFSQGAVIWVYISEIFPTPVRARGQSLGSSTHWLLNALISALFPVAAAYSRSAPFAFFAVMMAVQFFVVWLFFPETQRVSLEEMQGRIATGG